MSEPRGDAAVLRFFANALIAIGWLILALGGLCTLIFALLAVGGDREFRVSGGDWMLPLSMWAIGAAVLFVGRATKAALKRSTSRDDDV